MTRNVLSQTADFTGTKPSTSLRLRPIFIVLQDVNFAFHKRSKGTLLGRLFHLQILIDVLVRRTLLLLLRLGKFLVRFKVTLILTVPMMLTNGSPGSNESETVVSLGVHAGSLDRFGTEVFRVL